MEEQPQVLALLERGEALRRRGKPAEALEACKRALELDPHSSTAWVNKDVALCMLERYQEALAAYELTAG